MQIPKVSTGDRIRLGKDFLNKLIDLVNSAPNEVAALISGNSRPDTIQIKNSSGAAVKPQGILGIGASILKPDEDEMLFRYQKPVLNGVTPVLGTHDKKFCILLNGLDEDEIGPAQIFGLTKVRINMLNLDHEYARISDESGIDPTELLESDVGGPAHIIWSAAEEIGEAWCLIDFPVTGNPITWKITAVDEEEGTIDVRRVDTGGTLTGPTFTVTDYTG